MQSVLSDRVSSMPWLYQILHWYAINARLIQFQTSKQSGSIFTATAFPSISTTVFLAPSITDINLTHSEERFSQLQYVKDAISRGLLSRIRGWGHPTYACKAPRSITTSPGLQVVSRSLPLPVFGSYASSGVIKVTEP